MGSKWKIYFWNDWEDVLAQCERPAVLKEGWEPQRKKTTQEKISNLHSHQASEKRDQEKPKVVHWTLLEE